MEDMFVWTFEEIVERFEKVVANKGREYVYQQGLDPTCTYFDILCDVEGVTEIAPSCALGVMMHDAGFVPSVEWLQKYNDSGVSLDHFTTVQGADHRANALLEYIQDNQDAQHPYGKIWDDITNGEFDKYYSV